MVSLEKLVADLNKKSPNSARVGDCDYTDIPRIPAANARIEWLFRGGFPENRTIELFGPESAGKTLIMYRILREWQKLPHNKDRKAAIFDYECSHDDRWATLQGVDMKRVIVWTPQNNESAEELFDIMKQFADTKEVGFIVLDSIGSLVPSQRRDKDSFEDKIMGGISAPLTEFINDFNWRLSAYKITFVAINQMRDDMNSSYATLGKTPGGRAMKHGCSLRLHVSAGDYFDYNGKSCSQNSDAAGHHINLIVKKNKFSANDRKRTSITFRYLTGIDDFTDNIEFAVMCGLIRGSGAWYELTDFETGELLPKKLNGLKQVSEYYHENENQYKLLLEKLSEIIREK